MVAAATDMDAVATDTVVADKADTVAADTHTAVAAMPAERADMPVEHAQPTVAELEVALLRLAADLPVVAQPVADSAVAAASMAAVAVATLAVADTGNIGGLRANPQIAAEFPHKARLLRQAGFALVMKKRGVFCLRFGFKGVRPMRPGGPQFAQRHRDAPASGRRRPWLPVDWGRLEGRSMQQAICQERLDPALPA